MVVSSPDAVIVGGGVIGAACAYELAITGRDVVVVERRADWAAECSGANAGLICPSHSTPLASLENLRFALRHVGRPTSPLRVTPQAGLMSWMFHFLAAAVPEQAERNRRLLSRLAQSSLERWRDLSDVGVVRGLYQRGLLYAYASIDALEKAIAETTPFAAHHPPPGPEVLDEQAVIELVPAIEHPAGGLYFEGE